MTIISSVIASVAIATLAALFSVRKSGRRTTERTIATRLDDLYIRGNGWRIVAGEYEEIA